VYREIEGDAAAGPPAAIPRLSVKTAAGTCPLLSKMKMEKGKEGAARNGVAKITWEMYHRC